MLQPARPPLVFVARSVLHSISNFTHNPRKYYLPAASFGNASPKREHGTLSLRDVITHDRVVVVVVKEDDRKQRQDRQRAAESKAPSTLVRFGFVSCIHAMIRTLIKSSWNRFHSCRHPPHPSHHSGGVAAGAVQESQRGVVVAWIRGSGTELDGNNLLLPEQGRQRLRWYSHSTTALEDGVDATDAAATLVLIRHGQSTWNATPTFTGKEGETIS